MLESNMEKFKDLLKRREVQLVLALLLGITVGAIFYPTKRVEERVKIEVSERYELNISELKQERERLVSNYEERLDTEEKRYVEYQEEVSERMISLTTENRELKQSMKKKKFKLVKPDGTIIEREYEESQSEEVTSVVTEVRLEFDRKVASIEDKWKKVHQKRVGDLEKEYEAKVEKVRSEQKEKIVYVDKEKIVEVNSKKLRPEIGVNTDKEVYLHTTYSLWGPVFIGAGTSMNIETKEFGDARVGVGIEF